MQHNIILCFVLLSAAISASHCAWLVTTSARTCSTTPYMVQATNGNCALTVGPWAYTKITCDGSTASTYNCDSAQCDSCQLLSTEPLLSCNKGLTSLCFDSEPDLTKFVGPKYITDKYYSTGVCSGVPNEIFAWPHDQCLNMPYGSTSYVYLCQNSNVIKSEYNTTTCSGSPFKQTSTGPLNQCKIGNYQQCY